MSRQATEVSELKKPSFKTNLPEILKSPGGYIQKSG